ncbi:AsnC family transcriptional regulator [Acetobacter estunensis]|uniref:AsnC family transcriptional regulator n=1 Tax=Acetobacter estunensis TaxID=104097 RepID=A0A967EGY8_9PROT|nr:AsnC family transcriptional regulator [Acetobacter estunensis]
MRNPKCCGYEPADAQGQPAACVFRYAGALDRGWYLLYAARRRVWRDKGVTVAELDAVDRRIIAELQVDGRMTNVELARRVGISAPPCLRRVRRLEELGVISGYHADVDAGALGWPISFYAVIGLDSQKEAVLSQFEALVATWPEALECHMIRGGDDFLVRLAARDTTHENQLTRRLTEAPHVMRVQTLQTIRTTLSRPLVAVAGGEGET